MHSRIQQALVFMQIEFIANVLVICGIASFGLWALRKEPPSLVESTIFIVFGLFLIGVSIYIILGASPSSEQLGELLLLSKYGLRSAGSIPLAFAFMFVAIFRLVTLFLRRIRKLRLPQNPVEKE